MYPFGSKICRIREEQYSEYLLYRPNKPENMAPSGKKKCKIFNSEAVPTE